MIIVELPYDTSVLAHRLNFIVQSTEPESWQAFHLFARCIGSSGACRRCGRSGSCPLRGWPADHRARDRTTVDTTTPRWASSSKETLESRFLRSDSNPWR